MSIAAGARLGPYEVLALLGSGGMGEVYRARDVRLERTVAVKVLSPAFGDDPDRVARVQREARVLASLNHHNIAALYDVEEVAGAAALIMEYVDGPTLAERLDRGAMPVAEAILAARQIVDALDAAHTRGIVHRDLKPANIKLTASGAVKVLDFGLAKAVGGDISAVDVSLSPTLTAGPSGAGSLLGTLSYMSPEQARGMSVDRRADIWAFGCVLYEMLTGQQAFKGDTISDRIVSVLDRDPDWQALPPATPRPLRRLLVRCLMKDLRRRLRDIGDAAEDLDEADSPADPRGDRSIAPSHVEHVDVEFQRLSDFSGIKESPAISPDGRIVAFVAPVAGRRQIWIRLLAGGAPLQLTRDDVDHTFPRWAPDSNTVIYYVPAHGRGEGGTIWEIAALGGWPRRVTTSIGDADISHDGRRLALFQPAGDQLALVVAARDGSGVERLALLPPGSTYSWPRWSPDDCHIAFQREGNSGFEVAIEVTAVANGAHREVTNGALLSGFSWLPDGSGFVYSSARGSTMLYPPVCNLRMMSRDGSRDRQLTFGDSSFVEPDVHSSGKLVASRFRSVSDIWRFPIDGSPAENTCNAVRITHQTGHVQTPSASPDDTEVVYISDSGGHGNLWVTRTDSASARQITFETDPAVSIGVPRWSPRGDEIAFVRSRSGRAGLWIVRPDGSAAHEVAFGWAPCWSADGHWLYYWWLGDGPKRLEKIPIDGGDPVFVREEPDISLPAPSPDGSMLYFIKPVSAEILGFGGRAPVELRRAQPETAPSELLGRFDGDRISGRPGRAVPHVSLSPDGRWLATSLVDRASSNLWIMSTEGGPMRPVTDFGQRSTIISRSVSWTADSRSIYAAVAETEIDIVLLAGVQLSGAV